MDHQREIAYAFNKKKTYSKAKNLEYYIKAHSSKIGTTTSRMNRHIQVKKTDRTKPLKWAQFVVQDDEVEILNFGVPMVCRLCC